MIELLVVITIATIGVVFTSSTGDAESRSMADKTAKDVLNESDGQSGIGVLGIDVVARKARAVLGMKTGAISAAQLADKPVHWGEDDDEDFDLDDDDLERAEQEDAAANALLKRDVAHREGAPASQPAAMEPLRRGARPSAMDEMTDDDDDLTLAAYEDELDDWDDLDEFDDAQAEDAQPLRRGVMDNTGPVSPRRPARTQSTAQSPAQQKARANGTLPDTTNAPIVESFDPELDQILISYRPGEAGNGRIGIAEDPLRPGSACVTLGGRCVAVVLDAFGIVRAHHIELVCEDDEDIAA